MNQYIWIKFPNQELNITVYVKTMKTDGITEKYGQKHLQNPEHRKNLIVCSLEPLSTFPENPIKIHFWVILESERQTDNLHGGDDPVTAKCHFSVKTTTEKIRMKHRTWLIWLVAQNNTWRYPLNPK